MDLFEIDAAGDTDVRQTLERASSRQQKLTPKLTPQQKRRRLLAQERELSSLVFETASEVPADEEGVGDSDSDAAAEDDGEESDAESQCSELGDDGRKHAAEPESSSREPVEAPRTKAAWVDEDDEEQIIDVSGNEKGKSRLRKLRTSRAQTALSGAEYAQRLREQFQSVQPNVSWAALPEKQTKKRRSRSAQHTRFHDGATDAMDAEGDDDDEEDEEEEEPETDAVLRSSASLLGASATLPSDALSIRRLADLNLRERSQSVTPCVQWHPNGKLALTAGPDKTLRLFRTDGADNSKLQSIHLPKLPIASAAFSHDGAQIFMCGRGKQWATFDLHSGTVSTIPGVAGRNDKAFARVLPCPAGGVVAMVAESGAVLLLSAASKQLVATLQTGGAHGKFATQCATFSADGAYLYASGEGSSVKVWDVRRRCCVHSWSDRGGLRCTALAASPDGELVAAGSDSGAVNVYRSADTLRHAKPNCTKEYLNLTSAITTLDFHPTSELLCFASKYTKRGMRVAHVADKHVFANWPTGKSPLNYVQATAFAPHAGYMAIGNDQGKVLLYQLNHYAGM